MVRTNVYDISPSFKFELKVHNALIIVFPEGGGTPGCRWGNWRLCGDFAEYLCPCGGGNEGPLIYYAPYYGEIWGLCFH